MGCFPFANSHFQMGFTVMGFAEHFGGWIELTKKQKKTKKSNRILKQEF